ncbi:MAG: IMP cyclohydrolase [Clostridia bacterium]|nr:IMP cyclohydrolase [Clostridia bacterium]
MEQNKLLSLGERIAGNPYVGRGIAVGTTPDGEKAFFAYFIMGRSANSRNRIFREKDGVLFTEPFDETKVSDPSLIIYAAVRTLGGRTIVTNGDQTDTVYRYLSEGKTFEEALETRCFEPDAPNFTPRISALLENEPGSFRYRMSLLKSLDPEGSDCVRFFYNYPSKPGLGHFLHTYVTDGNPLPSFEGEPEPFRTENDIDRFTQDLWDHLDEDNRISLFVHYSSIKTGETDERLINRNEK